MSLLPFETVLTYLKEGGKATREAWNGTPKYVFIDDEYITIRCFTENGAFHSFTLYADDLLAEDWVFVIVEEPRDANDETT